MKYQNFYLGITLIFFLAGCDVNVSESSEAKSNPDTAVQGDQSSQEGFNKTITLDNGQDIARESMMLLDGGLKVPDVTTQDGASVSAPGVSGKTNVDGASRTYRFDQVKATSNGEEILLSGEYEVSESGGVTTLKGNDLKITGQQGDVVLSEFTVVTDRNNAVPTLSAEINADFSQFNRQVSIQIDPAFSGSDPLCPINGNMKIRAGDGSYVVVIAVPGGNLLLDINGEYITVSCGELKEDASTTSDSGASSTEDTSSGTSSSSSSESSSDEPESPETSSPETPSTSPSTGTDSSTSSDSPPTSSPEIPSTDISSGGSTSDEASQSSSGGDSNVTVSISDCSNLLIEIKGDVVTINCGGTGSGGTGSDGTGSGGTGSDGTGSGISPPSGPGSDGTGSDGTGSDGTGSGGTGSDGTSSDGTSSDGTSSDGTSSDGTSSDGTSSDGTSSDGTSSDGTGSDGTSSDGSGSDGTGSGITPPTGPSSEGSTSGGTSSDDGTSSNGTDSDGTNSDGTTPSSGGLTPPSAP